MLAIFVKVDVVFGIAIIADIPLITGLLPSMLDMERRVWPIGERSWRWWFNWSALSIVFVGVPALAYPNWESFIFTGQTTTIIGLVRSAIGLEELDVEGAA